MTKNDILALVRGGQSIDDIAEEFAQALNEAQKQLEQERSDAARKAELARAADKAAEAMNNYFKLRYPKQTFEPMSGELLDLIADSIMFGEQAPSWMDEDHLDKEIKKLRREKNTDYKTKKPEKVNLDELTELVDSFLALFDKPDRK